MFAQPAVGNVKAASIPLLAELNEQIHAGIAERFFQTQTVGGLVCDKCNGHAVFEMEQEFCFLRQRLLDAIESRSVIADRSSEGNEKQEWTTRH